MLGFRNMQEMLENIFLVCALTVQVLSLTYIIVRKVLSHEYTNNKKRKMTSKNTNLFIHVGILITKGLSNSTQIVFYFYPAFILTLSV